MDQRKVLLFVLSYEAVFWNQFDRVFPLFFVYLPFLFFFFGIYRQSFRISRITSHAPNTRAVKGPYGFQPPNVGCRVSE